MSSASEEKVQEPLIQAKNQTGTLCKHSAALQCRTDEIGDNHLLVIQLMEI